MNPNWFRFKNIRIIYPIQKSTLNKCINKKTRCFLCNVIHKSFGTARWVQIGNICRWICNKSFQYFLKKGKIFPAPFIKKFKRTLPKKFCSGCGRQLQSKFREANQNEIVFKKFPKCFICEECNIKPPSIFNLRKMIQQNPNLLNYLTKDLEIKRNLNEIPNNKPKTHKSNEKTKKKPVVTSKKRIHYDMIEKKAETLMNEEEDIKSITIQYQDLALSTIGPHKNPYQQLFSLKSQIPENVFRQVVDFHNSNLSVVCILLLLVFFFQLKIENNSFLPKKTDSRFEGIPKREKNDKTRDSSSPNSKSPQIPSREPISNGKDVKGG